MSVVEDFDVEGAFEFAKTLAVENGEIVKEG